MEIKVTALVEHMQANGLMEYSASACELGEQAGAITWGNACGAMNETAFVLDTETRACLIDHFDGYGAWERNDMERWSDNEVVALMSQFIASALREREGLSDDEVQEYVESGQIACDLFRADGEWYYSTF